MNMHITAPGTMADVLHLIDRTDLSAHRRRDMVSAIKRICEMTRCSPAALSTDVAELRTKLGKILPARHEGTKKTFSNLKSLFGSALEIAGVIEPRARGIAKGDSRWGPLLSSISHDKRLNCGLAVFANWCVLSGVPPEAVTDAHIQQFLEWLETRTLCPKPHNIVRRVPNTWNDARQQVEGWPQVVLTPVSFRPPSKHLTWEELDEGLHRGAKPGGMVANTRISSMKTPMRHGALLDRAPVICRASI